jgi:citrate synthase
VGKNGNPILMYRGYSICDLVRSSLDEIVYLILHNHLPNRDQPDDFSKALKDNMPLNREVQAHLKSWPRHVQLIGLTLTVFSSARMWDKDHANDAAAERMIWRR